MATLRPCRLRAVVSCIALGAVGLPAPAALAEVYRWVDKNGVVQYSDRKPKGNDAPVVERKVTRSTAPAAATPAESPAEAEAEAPVEAAPSADEQLAERDQIRASNCQQSRDNLKILEGRYRIQDGATGEYLDGKAREARMAQTRADIAENCS